MVAFQKQSPGQDSLHLPLDTLEFGTGIWNPLYICCRTAVSPPASAYPRLTRVCDTDGRNLPPRISLLCSASRSLTSSAQNFSHFTLPPWRGGLSQAQTWPLCFMDLGQLPQTLGENQCMAKQLISGPRKDIIFLRAWGCS